MPSTVGADTPTHVDIPDIDDFHIVDRPSMPSSTASFMTEDAHSPFLSASTVLPGGTNNKKKSKSVAFGSDTAPGDEPSADAFALGLRHLDAAGSNGCRDDTVRYLLSEHRWPASPASTTAAQKAEHGSSARAPTEASYVWVLRDDHTTDDDVAAAGIWSDRATPRPMNIDDSDLS